MKFYSTLHRTSQESELRKRNITAPQPPPAGAEQLDDHVGIIDQTSKAPTKSQQQETEEAVEKPKESSPVPGTWSPLLTNVCLCTALALSAYVCYRACFHWCLSFFLLSVPPCLSTDVAKWTRLANQPALTLVLLCKWVDYLDFSRFRFTRGWGWGVWLVGDNKASNPHYPPKHSFNMSSWMLRSSVFQVSRPKYVCRLKRRLNRRYVSVEGKGFVLAPLFCEPGWMACQPIFYTRLLSYLPNDTCMRSSISSFTDVSVKISLFSPTFSFFCLHKWSEIKEPDFWTSLSEKNASMGDT